MARLALVGVLLAAGACSPVPPAVPAEDISLMSFNIRTSSADDGANSWDRRASQVAALIASQAPDIVGLQEAQTDQVSYLAERLPAYRFVGRSRDSDPGAGEAVPLFFHAGRWALDPAEHGTFWLSDTPAVPGSRTWGNHFPRIVSWARLVHRPTGRALYVYNLHLDHESENARLESATLVNERVAARAHQDPVVVMGDFNAEPHSDVLRSFVGGELELRDSYTDTSEPDATFHGFTGERSGRRIDFILVSSEITVPDAAVLHDEVGGAYPSDHFPVIATIRFPRAL